MKQGSEFMELIRGIHNLRPEHAGCVSDAKEYLEYCPDLTLLEDSLGGTINIGDTVLVPEPNNSDLHQHSFVGNVEKFRNGNVVVIGLKANVIYLYYICLQTDKNYYHV